MLGMRYLNELANRYDMPLVICIALGSNMGGHNATLPITGPFRDVCQYSKSGSCDLGEETKRINGTTFYGKAENVNDIQKGRSPCGRRNERIYDGTVDGHPQYCGSLHYIAFGRKNSTGANPSGSDGGISFCV